MAGPEGVRNDESSTYEKKPTPNFEQISAPEVLYPECDINYLYDELILKAFRVFVNND